MGSDIEAGTPGHADTSGVTTEEGPRTSEDPNSDAGRNLTNGAGNASLVQHGRRRRQAASILCGIVSVLLLILGVSGVWVMRTATNDGWVRDQVATVLRDPQVSDQLANTLVNEVDKEVDFEAQAEDLLPDNLDRAAPILVKAARTEVEKEVSTVLRSDAVVNTAADAVSSAHRGAVAVLTDDASVPGVNLETGEVQLNLLPLVPRVIDAAHRVGLLPNVESPDLEGLDREQQLAAVSEALGRPLADDFAHPVVFKSDSLAQAGNTLNTVRTILLWTRRLFWLFIIAGIGLGVGALYLARNRPRAAVLLGLGYVVGFFLTRVVVGRALSQLPSIPANIGGQAAVRGITQSAASQLTGWYSWFGVGMIAFLALVWFFLRPTRRHS